MGVMFKAQNREKARTLGGQEPSLSELRAIRLVREHGRNPASAEELAGLDSRIHQLAGPKLIEDLAALRSVNESSLAKLAVRPRTRLSREGKMFLHAWLGRLEEFQQGFPEIFDIAHLLQAGDGADPGLRSLNLAYAYLCVLSNAEKYWTEGLLEGQGLQQTQRLQDAVEDLTTGSPLADHLESGRWFDEPHRLLGLPEEPITRIRLLIQYQDYLVLSVIANAFSDLGGLSIEDVDGTIRLSRAAMQLEPDPGAWINTTLDSLGTLLDTYLDTHNGCRLDAVGDVL